MIFVNKGPDLCRIITFYLLFVHTVCRDSLQSFDRRVPKLFFFVCAVFLAEFVLVFGIVWVDRYSDQTRKNWRNSEIVLNSFSQFS